MLRVRWKSSDALEEEAFELASERQRLGQRRPPSELRLGEHRWELDQCERVSVSLLDQSIENRWGNLDSSLSHQKRRGGLWIETLEGEGGNISGVEGPDVVLAHAEEHHDPLGVEATRDEQKGLGRCDVEPLRVVDDAENGAAVGKLREQRQASGKDEKALVRSAGLEPERDSNRGRLRSGKQVDLSNRGADELMQTRERELRFGLDRTRRQDLHVAGALAGVVQQGRLAD